MKSIILLLLFLFFLPTQHIDAQHRSAKSNPFFIQVGGGMDVYNSLQQVGFKQTQQAKSIYLETGLAKGLWRLGAYYKTGQAQEFYIHQLSEDHMGVYGKLNVGPFIRFLPYGIDPYLHASAGMGHRSFTTYNADTPDDLSLTEKITNNSLVNSFGAGIDFGRKLFVIGIEYGYSPGKEVFKRPEVAPLTFYAGNHSFEVRLGIRLYPSASGNGIKCPQFGKRKKGNTSF